MILHIQDERVVAVGVCFSILDYSIYIPELILVRIKDQNSIVTFFNLTLVILITIVRS